MESCPSSSLSKPMMMANRTSTLCLYNAAVSVILKFLSFEMTCLDKFPYLLKGDSQVYYRLNIQHPGNVSPFPSFLPFPLLSYPLWFCSRSTFASTEGLVPLLELEKCQPSLHCLARLSLRSSVFIPPLGLKSSSVEPASTPPPPPVRPQYYSVCG